MQMGIEARAPRSLLPSRDDLALDRTLSQCRRVTYRLRANARLPTIP